MEYALFYSGREEQANGVNRLDGEEQGRKVRVSSGYSQWTIKYVLTNKMVYQKIILTQ